MVRDSLDRKHACEAKIDPVDAVRLVRGVVFVAVAENGAEREREGAEDQRARQDLGPGQKARVRQILAAKPHQTVAEEHDGREDVRQFRDDQGAIAAP